MIQAFFFDLQAINGGGSRPEGIAKTPIKKIGVLGAGMMGAGIAYVSAKAGYDVVLRTSNWPPPNVARATPRSSKPRHSSAAAPHPRSRPSCWPASPPAADPAAFAGVDFVIEAVFENQELKHKVFQEIEDIVEPNALLGSNTSTLPITGLAAGVKRQEDFIGIHFFSPVDKMPLVEIIRGEKTSDETLARVFDYTLAIGKTPIVVNDSRGFYTSRVIGTFVNEALAMLGEGVEPASIEHAGTQAGYPAAPLQLSDELNLELMHKIATATRKAVEDAGGTYTPHPAELVVEKMIAAGRPSKLKGAGFYEYADGKRVGLWSGLRSEFGSGSSTPPLQDMIDRMLFAEVLETQKCFDEGVITSTADANIGSIMGIGFPPWTGGAAQFIVGYPGGRAGFVARAQELAAKYGGGSTRPPRCWPDLVSYAPSVTSRRKSTRFSALALRSASLRELSVRSGTLPPMIEPFIGGEALSHRAASPPSAPHEIHCYPSRRLRPGRFRVDAGSTREGRLAQIATPRCCRRLFSVGAARCKVDQCYAACGDLRLKSTPELAVGRALGTGRGR